MKLIELNLRAYGPFTNKVIAFTEASSEAAVQPGLHIVLGANEAGKSTALRALRAVLFGMNDMRDAHLHPKDMLRVTLKLRTVPGELLHVERRKGKGAKSLLFVGSAKAVPVEEWSRALPVDSPELFEQMYGLDYERLLEGGHQLAGFKNDIGQALLAAAGDLGLTVTRMREMQDRAEAIYSSRATSSKLRQALAAYQSADKAFRDERYTSREYKAAVARRDEIEEDLRRIARDRAQCAEDLNRLTRLQTAAPHVMRLIEDETTLASFTGSVLLAPDFEERYNTAITGSRDAEGRRDDATIEIGRLTQELTAVPRDAALAAIVAEIDRSKDLLGKIRAARGDCPKREAEWRRLQLDRDELCSQLGVPMDTVPHVVVEQRKRIEVLSGQRLILDAKLTDLPAKISGLQLDLREAEVTLADLPAEIDTTELSDLLGQARSKKQPEVEIARLRMERDQSVARFDHDLNALPLWGGSADELERLRVPLSASVSEFAERFVRDQTRSQQLADEQGRLTSELEACAESLRALEHQQPIPTESELADARARRELGWEAVKESWLQGLEGGPCKSRFLDTPERALPEAYEAAVDGADTVADQLRREADRVEQKRAAVQTFEAARRRLTGHEYAVEQHRAEIELTESEWKELWSPTGIEPMRPKEMQAWLEARAVLIGEMRDLNRLSAQLTEAEFDVKRWQKSLSVALGESSERTLAELVSRADSRVRAAASVRKARAEAAARIRQLKSNLEGAREEERRSTLDLQKWQQAWKSAIRGLPVSENADPIAVQEVIRTVDQIHSASEEMTGLRYRIDAMQTDNANYTEVVRQLALRACRHDLAEGDALVVIGELQTLARAAQTNETRAASISENLVREQQKLVEARALVARFQSAIDELRKEAQGEDAGSLPETIRSCHRRRELTARIDGHRAALANSCGNVSLEEFVLEVRNMNLDALPAELEGIRQEMASLEDAKSKNISERDGIDREFQLREAAQALSNAASEKFSAAARIDALATEYIEQQIGAKLLAKAMAAFREKNQDPMLRLAGQYFSTLTCGAFNGLVIDDVTHQRTLRGVRASTGEHLDLEAMSDGTRDQLFLALRLAYIETCCDKGTPCPVILDDVLMAFDDERTAAALIALRDLSRKTQVLVFTHHTHHVALAEQVLTTEEYRLHRLTTCSEAA